MLCTQTNVVAHEEQEEEEEEKKEKKNLLGNEAKEVMKWARS